MENYGHSFWHAFAFITIIDLKYYFLLHAKIVMLASWAIQLWNDILDRCSPGDPPIVRPSSGPTLGRCWQTLGGRCDLFMKYHASTCPSSVISRQSMYPSIGPTLSQHWAGIGSSSAISHQSMYPSIGPTLSQHWAGIGSSSAISHQPMYPSIRPTLSQH